LIISNILKKKIFIFRNYVFYLSEKKQEQKENSLFAYGHKRRKNKIIQKTFSYSHLARISASLKMKYSLFSISTLVPPYSGNKTLSPV
jgi:hypothetical protein